MEIAHGTIKVDLDDKEAIAGLRKLDAEFDRAMNKIEREHATATVDADLTKMEDKLANARRQLRKLEGEAVNVEIDGDDHPLAVAIKRARAEVKRLDGQKATIELDVRGEEKVKAAQLAAQKRQELMAKEAEAALKRQSRLQEQAAKENTQRVNAAARQRAALHSQEMREMRDAETEARRIDKEREGRALRIAQLQKQYAKSVREVERQSFRRKPLGREAKVEVELDRNFAVAKMEALKAELNAIGGHPPVDIKVDVDRGDRVKQRLLGMVDNFRNLGQAGQGLRGSIGPISGTLTTLTSAALVLAPALVAVAGALGALIAVAGSAVAGLGALSLGFAGGLIPAIAGVALVLKPLIGQLGDVKKAQDKYNTAVDKYGEGSKQANKAHHEMRVLLGHVDEATVKAFESSGKLAARWRELTQPSKAVAFTTIGQALRTAAADLDVFAKGTNRVFGAAGKAVQDWLKGLRSGEARQILGNLMGNFAKSIGPLGHGLGQIFTWLSRIANVASNFLPGIFKGFDKWATGIADAAKNTKGVQGSLKTMVDSLKSVGRLFVSSGKFLASFFAGGVKPGQDLADAMSDVLDGWTQFNKEHPEKIQEFFKNAVKDTERIATALADIGTAFYQVSQAVEPILQPLADVWDFLVKIAGWKTPDWGIQAQKDAVDFVKQAFVDWWNTTSAFFSWIGSQAGVVANAVKRIGQDAAAAGRAVGSIANKAVKIGVDFASGGIDKAKSAISSITKLGGQAVRIGFQFASGAVSAAIGIVKRLLGLGGAAVRIGASFASGVISGAIGLVRKLLGFGGSVVRIGASFASGVINAAIGLVKRLLAFTGRIVHIGTSVALGPINAALGVLRQVVSFAGRVITLHINIPTPHMPKLPFTHAKGRAAGGEQDSFVGEGGGPEFIANRKTGQVAMTTGPTLAKLGKDDYVIPTEPKYRTRGRLLAQQFGKDTGTDGDLSTWMKMFGVKGYAMGKTPPRTATKTAAQRQASRGYAKKDVSNKGAYTEINRVQALQQQEADQAARISLAEGRLKEPDSFIVKTGVDAEGDDIYAVDQGAVNKWSADLANMREMYNALVKILKDLAKAVQDAIHAVTRTINQSNHNIGVLNTQETHEKNVIKGAKGRNKNVTISNAKQRLQWLKQEEERQKQIRQDATDSQDDLVKETQFAGGVGTPGKPGQRILEAMQEADSYNTDSAAVAAMAAGQAASANPQPKAPTAAATPGPFDALNLTGQALDAESALTAIGQGSRSPSQIIADKIANDQSIINTAKGLLTDADPTNDSDAYSAITGAANDIASLQASSAAGTSSTAAQQFSYGGAVGDVFRSYGNNFQSSLFQPAASGPITFGGGAAPPAGAGGTTIQVVNNYTTQPADPHTWSRDVLFELQAAS